MRPLIALILLGRIATSASAAGTDIRALVDEQTGHTVISEQDRQSEEASRAIDISAAALPASVIGKRR